MTATLNFGVTRGFADTIVRSRAAQKTDSRGLPVPQRDWATADTLTVIGVTVQPLSSREARGNDVRAVTTEYVLITPARRGDVDIQRGDRITWNSRTLEVIGDPDRWPAILGGIDHVEAILQAAPPYAGAGGDTTDSQLAAGGQGAASGYGWSL